MLNLCGKCEPYETEYIEKCKKGNCMYKTDWDSKFGIIDDKKVIDGVGKDAPIITNKNGGKQAKAPMAMHLVDPEYLDIFYKEEFDTNSLYDEDNYEAQCLRLAIRYIAKFMINDNKINLLLAMDSITTQQQPIRLAKTLQEGAEKYEPNNWRLIPQEEHINHALIHLIAHLEGDRQDNHIDHALARLMMAYATKRSEGFEYRYYVKKIS